MDTVEVIADPGAAVVALDPRRSRLLAELGEPASAASLAARLGVARQNVNYHLHALETHGLVRQAGERRWGGLKERLLIASAASYIVSPAALGRLAADPAKVLDHQAASYLVALAGRVVREVGDLMRRAARADKHLATLAIDTEIRFRSAADRAAFSRELVDAVTSLAAHYHDAAAPAGRAHRLVIVAHPVPREAEREE